MFWQREAASQATIDAPRRLLQFAVRDAVGTLKPPGLVKEPSLKRLRSVVSTSTENPSLVDRPRRLQSIARIPNPMATVMKAVQEAAEDAIKVKSAGSVFDRLGRDMDVSETAEQVAEFRDAAVEDEYEEFNQIQVRSCSNYLQRSDYSAHVGNMGMECETRLGSDSMSYNEGDDDVNVMGQRVMDVSQTGTSAGNKGEDSLLVQYSVAKDQEKPVSAAKTSRKMVNISVNVNTWKQPHYQLSWDDAEMDNGISVQENEADAGKSGLRLMKGNSNPVSVGNGNVRWSNFYVWGLYSYCYFPNAIICHISPFFMLGAVIDFATLMINRQNLLLICGKNLRRHCPRYLVSSKESSKCR